MFKLVLLAAVVGAAVAGGKEKCPWVMGKYPFDEQKFAGEWRIVQSLPNHYMMAAPKCGKFDYQVTKDAHVITFNGIGQDGKAIKGEAFGQPIFGKSEKSANLMSVWRKENGNYTGVFKQSIAATDYENYAVLIACRPVFDETTKTFGRHLKAGILARGNKSLSADTIEVLKNLISGYDIDVSGMVAIDQTNC